MFVEINFDNIPNDLRTTGALFDPATKEPRTISGALAKINDPSTWSAFDDLVAAAPDGFGYAHPMQRACGIVFLDFDDPERVADKLKLEGDARARYIELGRAVTDDMLRTLHKAGASIEYSRSGKGWHAYVRGTTEYARYRIGGIGDIYTDKQFAFVTGAVPQGLGVVRNLPLLDVQALIDGWVRDDIVRPVMDVTLGDIMPTDAHGRRLDLTDAQVLAELERRYPVAHRAYSGGIGYSKDFSDDTKNLIGDFDKITGDGTQVERLVLQSPRMLNAGHDASGKCRWKKTARVFWRELAKVRGDNDRHLAEKAYFIEHGKKVWAQLQALGEGQSERVRTTVEGEVLPPTPQAITLITYESVVADIEAFRVKVVAGAVENKTTFPDALEPIIQKIALLHDAKMLGLGQLETLKLMMLGTGVKGFAVNGNRGVGIINEMFKRAVIDLLNRQRESRGEDWRDKLLKNFEGTPYANEHNVHIAVGALYNKRLVLDEFYGKITLDGAVTVKGDSTDILMEVQCQAIPLAKPAHVRAVTYAVAKQNRHNSLQDKLAALEWDGIPRVDTWTQKFLNIADTQFYRTLGKFTLIQAIARAFQPGCQAQMMTIFAGDQGVEKSKLIAALSYGLNIEFANNFMKADGLMEMRGKWFVEMSEVAAFAKREASEVKTFVTRTKDTYRIPYDEEPYEYPRQYVLVGTVNPEPFLRDATGSRRFGIIDVKGRVIDLAGIERDRDQLWAEALARYRQGEVWWADLTKDAWFYAEQERVNAPWQAVSADPWLEAIERFVWHDYRVDDDGKVKLLAERKAKRESLLGGATWVLSSVLGVPVERQDQRMQNRVTTIMKNLGYGTGKQRDPDLRDEKGYGVRRSAYVLLPGKS